MQMNNGDKFLYEKESRLIYDACNEIWKAFGGSFKENVVDNALTIALEKRGLKVDNQKRVNLFFEDKKVGVYVIDKVINDKIIIETKCKNFTHQDDIRQFWRYLKASEYRLGFLVNFSPKRVEIVRRVYDTARNKYVA